MAIGNVGRPRSAAQRDTEIVAIPVPRLFKESLEHEARARGCRSLAEFVRQQNDWPDVSRRMGPKQKEASQAK